MPSLERTVVLLKPDAVQRGYIGEVIHRFERKGLQIVSMKMMKLTHDLLDVHYAHHVGKGFFDSLKEFMMSTPVIAMIWQGPEAVAVVRTMLGPTKGHEAPPGTIRGDFSVDTGYNLVHASDSTETAAAEIERFFSANEIFSYDKTLNSHVFDTSR